MQQLIQDLLTYSRTSRTETKTTVVSLSQVLELVISDLEPRIQERGARVVIEGELPAVMGSPTELRQVFQNLIGNGLKFNRSPVPEVRVSAVMNATDCVVAVSDNGIGIEPEYHATIFKVFQRLHTRDKFPGTGIGLAICKKIVERHGGRIWLDSGPDHGSTFFFTLQPAPAGDRPAPRSEVAASAG
jgi:light-regulated signal transduction histidine kinase (bacteriophytochrome)